MSTSNECQYDKIINDANIGSCISSSVLTTLRRIHALVRQNSSNTLNCGSNAERLLLGALACTASSFSTISNENVEAPPCFMTIVGDDNPVISIVHHLSMYGSSGFCAKGPLEGRILGFVNALDGATLNSSALPPIVKAPALETSSSLFGSLNNDRSVSIVDAITDLWSRGAEEKLQAAYRNPSCDTTPISDFDFLIDFYETHDHSTLIRPDELISMLERRKIQSSSVQQRKANSASKTANTSQSIIKLEDSSDDEQNKVAQDVYGGIKQKRSPQSTRGRRPCYDITKLMWLPREWASYLLKNSENGSMLSPYRAFHLIYDKILGMNSAYDECRRMQFRENADPILQWLAFACLSKPSAASIMDESSSFVNVRWEPIISYPPKLITWGKSMLHGQTSNGISSKNGGAEQIVASVKSHVVETENVPVSSEACPVSSNRNHSFPKMTSTAMSNEEERKQAHVSNQEPLVNERKNNYDSYLTESFRDGPSPNHHSQYRPTLVSKGCAQTPSSSFFDCADDSSLTITSTSSLQHQNQTTTCIRRSNNAPQTNVLSSSLAPTTRPIITCLGMILISKGAIFRKLDRRRETQDLENTYECKLFVEEHKMDDGGGGGYKFVVAHESIEYCHKVLQAVQDRFVYRSGGVSIPASGVHVAFLTQIPKPLVCQVRQLFWCDNFSLRLSIEQLHCCQIYFAGNAGGTEGEFATTKYVEHYSKLPAHYFAHNHRPTYKSKYDLFFDSTADIERSGNMSSTSKQATCVLVTGLNVQQCFEATLDVLYELEKVCICDGNENRHQDHQEERPPPRQLQQLQLNLSREVTVQRPGREHKRTLDDDTIGGYWPGEADGPAGPYGKKRRISSFDRL